MSEHIGAEIRIGGKVPDSLVQALCQAIGQERAALDWGEAAFSPTTKEELLAARQDLDGVLLLQLYDDQAPWGKFEMLEHFLRENDIPFDRLTEAKYEFAAEIVMSRPGGGLIELPTDPQHHPVILAESLRPIARSLTNTVRHCERGDTQKVLRAARRIQRLLDELLPPAVPPLETFEIVEEPLSQ